MPPLNKHLFSTKTPSLTILIEPVFIHWERVYDYTKSGYALFG